MASTTTAAGSAALAALTSGTDNTALGAKALTDTTSGSENVAVGSQAGKNNVSGGENIIIGYDLAPTLMSGSSNIIIGAAADVPTSSTSNYLNIGGVITGNMSTGAITLADGFMATTQSPLDNSTKIATTAYVDAAVTEGEVRTIGFSSISPALGQQGTFVVFPVAGTITGWSIVADAGTATVKVWKIASGTSAPTSANNINTSGVSLSTGTAIISSTVSDFTTTTVSANDIFAFDLTTVSGVTLLDFQLQITVA